MSKEVKKPYAKWTEEEVSFLKENYSTSTGTVIAGVLGKTVGTVYAKASSLGLKRPVSIEIQKKRALQKRCKENAHAPRWTESQVLYLKNNVKKVSFKELAEKLGKSVSAVRCKASSLSRVSSYRAVPDTVSTEVKETANKFKAWTAEDEQFLKENYGKLSVTEIANKLKRTEDAIKGRAYAFELIDSKAINRAKWTKEEINFLKKNINSKTNEEMAQYLGRSVASIAAKLSDLRLRKAFPLRNKKKGKLSIIKNAIITSSVILNVFALSYIAYILLK